MIHGRRIDRLGDHDDADKEAEAGRNQHGDPGTRAEHPVRALGATPVGFTLREAARLVGVTHTAPYRHFPDKSALLAAVALEGVTGMRDAMIAATRDVADPVDRLEALGVAYVTYAVAHPSHFRVMYGKSFDDVVPELAEAKRQTLAMLLEVVAACQAAGAFPRTAPEPLAVACWSAVHGLATLLIEGTIQAKKLLQGSPAEIAQAVTRVLIARASGSTGSNTGGGVT